MTLKPKVGKRYVRRDGMISDPLILNRKDPNGFAFMDPKTKEKYTICGGYWLNTESKLDLIREYKPEWRVAIKCESRAQARRISACLNDDRWKYSIPNDSTVEKSS